MSTITNKTILITGANRGIGKAILENILKENPKKVYATARDTSKINTNDDRVEKITLDITDDSSIKKLENLNNLDLLINNAGIFDFGDIQYGNDKNMLVNYYSTMNVTETLIPKINNGGSITFISSIIGLAPMAMASSYSASKAAIHSYLQSQRNILKEKDISISGVYPGAIDTDMTKGMEVQKLTSMKQQKTLSQV